MALTVAAFLVSLDRAIFAPLLPAIARDLQAPIAAAGLAVTAYTVPYGVCQLFYGPVADRAGKIAVVRWAVVVFALSTGVCALAPSLPTLQLLRVLAGGAAAAVIPLSLAYIGDAVPYERRQQRREDRPIQAHKEGRHRERHQPQIPPHPLSILG